jgi:DUF4097 and DUF4098 domain-containing protein YvlB
MRHFAIPLLAGAVFCCTQAPAQKLEFKEHISKAFTITRDASASTLAIYNINGYIRVEGYEGSKVVLEIDKTITAKNEADLQKGKTEFKLEYDEKADSVIAYISQPFDSRPNRNRHDKNDRKVEYSFVINYTVKVPHSLNLHVSTVNGGDLEVSDVTGTLDVSNVNGAVKIVNAKGKTVARTINGNVEANYITLPPGESDYKTLNGDIKISYPATLSADCQFKSFNGDFFTDFPNAESLPPKVVKSSENQNSKTVYKLNTETMIRFGKGGQTFKFETFNGNIYIKKQS